MSIIQYLLSKVILIFSQPKTEEEVLNDQLLDAMNRLNTSKTTLTLKTKEIQVLKVKLNGLANNAKTENDQFKTKMTRIQDQQQTVLNQIDNLNKKAQNFKTAMENIASTVVYYIFRVFYLTFQSNLYYHDPYIFIVA